MTDCHAEDMTFAELMELSEADLACISISVAMRAVLKEVKALTARVRSLESPTVDVEDV